MPDRLEPIARLLCLGLAALLLLEIVHAVLRGNPLGRVSVPDLPTLPKAAETNVVQSNSPAALPAVTNVVKSNSIAGPNLAKSNSLTASTVVPSHSPTASNVVPSISPAGSNVVSSNSPAGSNVVQSNSPAGPAAVASAVPSHSPPPPPAGGKKTDLPPAVQKRVTLVTESGMLAPFMRPLPMALLGIAGEDAFLRAPDGQTGMVREGGDLGALKLLRIGINRVLVEENGEKKELTLFSGLGGESLLPPATNASPTNSPLKKKETL